MRIPARWFLLALLCGAGLAAHAGTPSFLCSKAKSWTEKTICASDRLSDLDLELASAYARLLRTTTGEQQKALTRGQTKWWASREECRKTKDPTTCLEERYTSRIAALKEDPSYTEARPGPVELPPERLAAVGEGWSKSLGRYLKPIRACLRRTKEPISAITVVWERDDGQTLGVRMRARSGFQVLCVVQRDASQVLELRDTNPYEPLPEEGPIFYPDPSAPPPDACGKPVQILDELDAPSGWLGPSCTPKRAKPVNAPAQKDPEAAPGADSQLR
jgi:uncharacterized protein YecT (DUF1311 family)